ncbi:21264_t:CDS:1, partial [Gigaspora margarita]
HLVDSVQERKRSQLEIDESISTFSYTDLVVKLDRTKELND